MCMISCEYLNKLDLQHAISSTKTRDYGFKFEICKLDKTDKRVKQVSITFNNDLTMGDKLKILEVIDMTIGCKRHVNEEIKRPIEESIISIRSNCSTLKEPSEEFVNFFKTSSSFGGDK